MTKIKIISLFVFVALLALSACNLPVSGSTPTIVVVKVNAPSEYRTGPSEDYPVVGVLNPDQEAEAVGISQNGDYFLIKDPTNPAALVVKERISFRHQRRSCAPANAGRELTISGLPLAGWWRSHPD